MQSAIDAGKAQGRKALYFGCIGSAGHYLHEANGNTMWSPKEKLPGFPWSEGLMDGGLLKNGERPDVCDGKVYWTCGGRLAFWYAFSWWDRSVDSRRASNSGFYVRGFGFPESTKAFDYACETFPLVVARQLHPLILQEPRDATA